EPFPATGSAVGIDMGVANFLADSNGEFVPNPRHGQKAAARLEVAQQALSRCKRRSNRRRKAVETVARLHRKVRRQRLDHAHKIALDLVRQH
ncbi:transposase, partial [Streptomyces gibsoniae]